MIERSEAAFAAAVECARAAGDTVMLAEAALGLAGGVHESVGYNLTGVPPAVVELLERACAELPADALALRAMVTVRLAGARYDISDVDAALRLSDEALQLAQRSGDSRAIAAALAMRHTALSGPESLDVRLALDRELGCLEPTRAAVQAHVWYVGDMLECGRLREVDREIELFRHGPLAHAEPRAAWYVALYESLRAQIEGRLDDANDSAERAREIGERVGVRTAGISFAVQTLFTARERGMLDGLPELLDALALEHPRQPGFVVTAAWARVELGLLDDAREQLDLLARDDFASLPHNGVWLSNVRSLADIAHALHAQAEAKVLYKLLLPYRNHHVVTSRVLSYWGSVEQPLGVLAMTLGDLPAARAHLERARTMHERIDAPLLLARTDLAQAQVLAAGGDNEAATHVRDRVHELAGANGWTTLAALSASG
jgi:tetratricopeptide (TPR) repeat protein